MSARLPTGLEEGGGEDSGVGSSGLGRGSLFMNRAPVSEEAGLR